MRISTIWLFMLLAQPALAQPVYVSPYPPDIKMMEIFFRDGDQFTGHLNDAIPAMFPEGKWVNIYDVSAHGDLGEGRLDITCEDAFHFSSADKGVVDIDQKNIYQSCPPERKIAIVYTGEKALWWTMHYTSSDEPSFIPLPLD